MRKGVLALVLFGLLVTVSMFAFVKTPQTNAVAMEDDTATRTDPYNLLTDYRDTQWNGWNIDDYENPWNQQWHNWSTYRMNEMYDQTEFWLRCKNMTEDYQWLDDINATTNGDEVGLMKEDLNLTQSYDDPMNFTYPRSDKQLTAKYYEEMNHIGVINMTINPLGLLPNPTSWTNPLLGAGKEINVEVWVDTDGDYDFEDPSPTASIEGMMRFDFNWWDTPFDPANPVGTIEPYTTVAREMNSPTNRQMEEFADGIGYWLDLDDDGHPNIPGDIQGGRIWVLTWRTDNQPDDFDNRTMDLLLYCGYTEKLSWISLPYLHPKQLPVADTGDDMGFPENKDDWEEDPKNVDPIFSDESPQIKEGEIITFDATHSYDPQDDVGADGIGYGAPDWPGPDTGEDTKSIDNGFDGGDGWRSNNYGEMDRLKYQWEAKVSIPGYSMEQTIRISGGLQSSPILDWKVKLPAMDQSLPVNQQFLTLNVTLTVIDGDRNQGTHTIQVLAYKSQNAPMVSLTAVPQIPADYENRGEAWVLPQQHIVFNGYAFDPDPNSELFFYWDIYGPYGIYYHHEHTNILDYLFTEDEIGTWNVTLTVYDGPLDSINTLSGNKTLVVHVISNNDPVPVIRASHNPVMESYSLGQINSTKNRVIYFNGSLSYDPDIWMTDIPLEDDRWGGLPGFDEDGDGVPDVSLKYQWDWGDGTRTESFSQNAQAEYKWQDRGAVQTGKKYWPVTLRIWDGRSTMESDPPFIVNINLPPTANAGPNLPPQGEEIEVGMTVDFDGSRSYDPNDDPNYDNKRDSEYQDRLLYTWDFGDGSATVMGRALTHEYNKAGTFTVMLTVSDGEFTDTSTTKVKVIPANQGPVGVVEITSESWKDIDTREVFTNVRMTFDASQSYDPDGDAYLDDKLETSPLDDLYGLTWDLGDGTVSKLSKVDHIYKDNGTYTVTIRTSDSKGMNWSESYTIEVANRLPHAVSVDDTITQFYDEQPVMFSGEGSYDEDGEIIGYYWDFGDGTHSDLSQGINGYVPSKVVAHTYEKTGLYAAKLYVMDDDRENSEVAFEINVQIQKSDSGDPEPTPVGTGTVIGGAVAFVALLVVGSTFFIRMRKRL